MDTSILIPAWLVAASWIYTGFIWIATRAKPIRMDSTIWGVTFLMVGLLYLSSYLPTGESYTANDLDYLRARVFVSRLLMLVLSLSQWLPLTVSYFRKGEGNEF